MQMSIGVEYALHSLFYMVDIPTGKNISIKELAKLNGLSETYLSKIFTKMKKYGLVRSITGVKGGYELAKSSEDISFWDIVESIEGCSSIFQCAEIRQKNILADHKKENYDCPCIIKIVMAEAENEMRKYLKNKTLKWLYNEAYKTFSDDKKNMLRQWIENPVKISQQ